MENSSTSGIFLDAEGRLCRAGERLDPAAWIWRPSPPVDFGRAVSEAAAVEALSIRVSLRHLVVGVIGPRQATGVQKRAAEQIGARLGGLGVTVVCGGKTGVMAAVCRGCTVAGGLAIGILPGDSPADANPYVGVPLPTGLNEGRNMVIARAARVLIAIGGSYGTLSEVAFGLHFSKTVIGLEGAPAVEGVVPAEGVDEALELALAALLATAQRGEAE